jgi:hypothetical protein
MTVILKDGQALVYIAAAPADKADSPFDPKSTDVHEIDLIVDEYMADLLLTILRKHSRVYIVSVQRKDGRTTKLCRSE